jgi:predicted nucleic acid-binding protein
LNPQNPNEFDDTEIARLLRLKRYELPPPAYFDNFLHEFHRRQRNELLREPMWRIALQRAQDFMFRLNVPALSSGPVAVAAVLVAAAIFSLKVYEAPQVAAQPVAVANVVPAPASWSLRKISVGDFSSPVVRNVKDSSHTRRAAAVPRYVLDSTPVSYEPSLRF